jgi:hypothetical protein
MEGVTQSQIWTAEVLVLRQASLAPSLEWRTRNSLRDAVGLA